jgi:hypothetical protein
MKHTGEVCQKITENAETMKINDAAADKSRN